MRTPNLKDLTEAWADRYCTEHDDLDHDNGCPAQQVAQNWLAEQLRQAKETAWDEGVTESGLDLDYLQQLLGNNPYRSQS